jgi:ATP-dependent DNA ligase
MKGYIDKIDFHSLEPQRYWTPPASWSDERKKEEVHNAIFSGDYIGSRKMDGALYKFVKDEDGNMELLGRNKSVNGDYLNKIEWVPHLQPFFDAIPNGTCLLGEIYFPQNEGSNHVTTIMGCLKEKAIKRQEVGEKLSYYIFDVLAYDNKSFLKVPVEERIKKIWELPKLVSMGYLTFALYYEGAELWNELQSILADGGEGIVITKKGTCYQPGKRPARQTFKVKKELQESLDVVIMGANSPTREYTGKDIVNWQYWENIRTHEKLHGSLYKQYSDGESIEPVTKTYWNGWAGSLVIGARKDDKVVVIGSLSGMTEEVLSNWEKYKGCVAEITGMQIHETGGIRHPKFLRWRPDLNVRDTDWYRIFGEN